MRPRTEIDNFERRLRDTGAVLASYMTQVVPTWTSDLLGVEAVLRLRKFREDVLDPVFKLKNDARRAFEASRGRELHQDAHVDCLLLRDRSYDLIHEWARLIDTVAVGMVIWHEIAADPTGRRGELALDTLLSPFTPRSLASLDQTTRQARRLEGAWIMVGELLRNLDSWSDRPRSYLATVAANEAARIQRDQEMSDRDHLGLTPKERSLRTSEEKAAHRERARIAIDPDDADLVSNGPDALAILMAIEDQRDQEADIAAFRSTLPLLLVLLFDLIRNDVRQTAACRALGIPVSAANALRNRARRFRTGWKTRSR